ncbi:MAG: fructosamine kinase family protein [Longimicrobiales bacterium]|nr:fructosamine kinase family protein [Longimicrobiales bacterium]
MRLPVAVRKEVGAALGSLGAEEPAVAHVAPVSGGCVSNGARIEDGEGNPYFLKWNAEGTPDLFLAESDGLQTLRRAAAGIDEAFRPVVPRPLAAGGESGPAWLLMEWIQPSGATGDSDERLGRGLALLHGAGAAGSDADAPAPRFGWHRDNWIGSLPQANAAEDDWSEFWRARRIVPQLSVARDRGHLRDPVMDRLVEAIPAALDGVAVPALLHGDLWSGNRFATAGGATALVDPAVYQGDGEVDLAMTELFGGFSPRFYSAYRDVREVSAAYDSHRRALYQLYYLLVHVNLFGGGYVRRSLAAAGIVVAAVR